MQVVIVSREQRAPFNETAKGKYQTCIENRHSQHKERQSECYESGSFGLTEDAASSYHEAEEERAAVAHENFGRVEVEDQKACNAAEKCEHQHGHRRLTAPQGEDSQRAANHGGYAGRQAVETVDNSDTDGNSRNPAYGQRYSGPACMNRQPRAEPDCMNSCAGKTEEQ